MDIIKQVKADNIYDSHLINFSQTVKDLHKYIHHEF